MFFPQITGTFWSELEGGLIVMESVLHLPPPAVSAVAGGVSVGSASVSNELAGPLIVKSSKSNL